MGLIVKYQITHLTEYFVLTLIFEHLITLKVFCYLTVIFLTLLTHLSLVVTKNHNVQIILFYYYKLRYQNDFASFVYHIKISQ